MASGTLGANVWILAQVRSSASATASSLSLLSRILTRRSCCYFLPRTSAISCLGRPKTSRGVPGSLIRRGSRKTARYSRGPWGRVLAPIALQASCSAKTLTAQPRR